jgi:hypothetical protein
LPIVATSTAELSGVHWIKKFAATADIKDLTPSFRKAVEAFVDAMTAADVKVRISSTYRSPERSYLMHWCWKGAVTIKKADGVTVLIKAGPHSGMNRQLKEISATYGVKKFVGGAKDKPHWSATGR